MKKASGSIAILMFTIVILLGLAASALTAERHPEIRAAQRDLVHAKARLEKAAHDYAGHRVKAIEHISEAQEELKMALESDTK